MKVGLAGLYRHFDGLARRERQLVFLAFVAIVWGLTFAAVIDPALARAQALQRRIADHQTQLSAFKNTQEELLRHLGQDVNEKVRPEFKEIYETNLRPLRVPQFFQF